MQLTPFCFRYYDLSAERAKSTHHPLVQYPTQRGATILERLKVYALLFFVTDTKKPCIKQGLDEVKIDFISDDSYGEQQG